jgi:hypothetical protein
MISALTFVFGTKIIFDMNLVGSTTVLVAEKRIFLLLKL